MEILITKILQTVITSFIIVILSIGTNLLHKIVVTWITKVENEEISNKLLQIEQVIEKAVNLVKQTYVDELKKENSFDEAAQSQALAMAKLKAMQLMNDEIISFITKYYGNTDQFITMTIEDIIAKSKK